MIFFNELKLLTNAECPEIHGEAKKGEQRISCISYKKIKTEHHWMPEMNFIDGLRETVNYFKS